MNKDLNKIIICNAPPGSGKDTLCDYVISYNKSFATTKFAEPLKKAAKELYGLSDAQVAYYESDVLVKKAPQEVLYGKSWREVLISLSEEYMKPLYGKDVFGKILCTKIDNIKVTGPFNIIVSDGGFNEEVVPLIEAYGKDKIVILKIDRKGCLYDGDSRKEIDAVGLGVKEYRITNKKIEAFFQEGYHLVSQLATQK